MAGAGLVGNVNPDNEVEIDLGKAIADTEDEIFSDALGEDQLENDGDRTLEEADENIDDGENADDDEADEDADEETGEADPDADPDADAEPLRDPQGRFKGQEERRGQPEVPLREERARRRAAEAERDGLKSQLDQLTGRLQGLETRVNQPPPQPRPPVQQQQEQGPPDMFADPEGYQNWLEQRTEARIQARINEVRSSQLNEAMLEARAEYGADFDEAYTALVQGRQDPVVFREGQRIVNARDPGKALMNWHNKQKAMAAIGDDPNGYIERERERIRTELLNDPETRKTILAEMRAQARTGGNDGRPQAPRPRMPSLNGASGGNSHRVADADMLDNSDNSVFAFATR
jgi:hypothetical protein